MGNNRISTGKRYFLLRATEVYRIPLPRLTANQHSSARSHTASPEFHFSGAIPVFRLTMPARGVMFLKSQHPNHISGGIALCGSAFQQVLPRRFFKTAVTFVPVFTSKSRITLHGISCSIHRFSWGESAFFCCRSCGMHRLCPARRSSCRFC